MSENPLHVIMNAKSVAFFGASNNPLTMGTHQITHLINESFEGTVWPIHPKEKTVLGVKAYNSVADLPETPELAVIVVPTHIVTEILDQCGQKGIKRAVIISGGFKERGEEGEKLEIKLKEVARKHQIRFVGPNCIGVINAHRKFNLTVYPYLTGPGPMGVLSHSGTYVTQVIPYLAKRGIRYSKAVSLGNEADIDLVDALEYLGQDPETKAIALYIESIRRGREFVETARQVSLKKPIVAYYVGGTEAGARSGSSHTGAMGGNDIIHDFAFRQCGIIRAPTVERLYDWAWALATTPTPKGRRVGIISHSGGPLTSMADACARNDIEVPLFTPETQNKLASFVPKTGSTANPVDFTYSTNINDMLNTVPNIVFEAEEVDAILIHGIGGFGLIKDMGQDALGILPMDFSKLESEMAKMHHGIIALQKEKSYPVITASFTDHTDAAVNYLLKNDVPFYSTPERAVLAMSAVMRYAEWKRNQIKISQGSGSDQ
ncbi:MAG: CoA-binding protein [Deltaproteobacteria bacterium]|nr:CoA-binding protein [Deltaproteobacteria bacterium]MBW2053673.1 CoA-binding protein [Deltaproteobacteria bacterium]MBW2141981.1 CoA-binding protein [Deltaproteobacteria bacterium]MBW2324399.1 CoA-binding protein [Deltaproteobacteria bacterium]